MPRLARRIIFYVLFLCTFYTVLRYHVFKGVEWTHFPLYILNKILSFSGFVLLVLSLALEPVYKKLGAEWFENRKFLGRTGMMLIIIHVLMSFLLFRPEVYSKFFGVDGSLNSIAEWSMMFGVFGMAAYMIMHNSFSHMSEVNGFAKFIRSPLFGISALVLSTLHLAIMGFEGWLTPGKWYGGMPSITMVSTFVFLLGMLIYFIGESKKTDKNG